MTFKELQDDVLSDRFAEAKRTQVKTWINYRYGRLWGSEDWPFKVQTQTLNVALNASQVSLGTFKTVQSVWDTTISPSFQPLPAKRPEVFYDWAQRVSGYPVDFTVIGTNLILDKPVTRDTTLLVLGEVAFTLLVADGDVPLIPTEFHLMLSSAGQAEGLKNENDPSWQGAETDYQTALEDLKRAYGTSVRTYGGSYPSWPQISTIA